MSSSVATDFSILGHAYLYCDSPMANEVVAASLATEKIVVADWLSNIQLCRIANHDLVSAVKKSPRSTKRAFLSPHLDGNGFLYNNNVL